MNENLADTEIGRETRKRLVSQSPPSSAQLCKSARHLSNLRIGHPRLLMRGLTGARAEIGVATMAYDLKRVTNVFGAAKPTDALRNGS
jgi:hypothetical protein